MGLRCEFHSYVVPLVQDDPNFPQRLRMQARQVAALQEEVRCLKELIVCGGGRLPGSANPTGSQRLAFGDTSQQAFCRDRTVPLELDYVVGRLEFPAGPDRAQSCEVIPLVEQNGAVLDCSAGLCVAQAASEEAAPPHCAFEGDSSRGGPA